MICEACADSWRSLLRSVITPILFSLSTRDREDDSCELPSGDSRLRYAGRLGGSGSSKLTMLGVRGVEIDAEVA